MSGIKTLKARLTSASEARMKAKPQDLAAKKTQGVPEEMSGTEPETAAKNVKLIIKKRQEMPRTQFNRS